MNCINLSVLAEEVVSPLAAAKELSRAACLWIIWLLHWKFQLNCNFRLLIKLRWAEISAYYWTSKRFIWICSLSHFSRFLITSTCPTVLSLPKMFCLTDHSLVQVVNCIGVESVLSFALYVNSGCHRRQKNRGRSCYKAVRHILLFRSLDQVISFYYLILCSYCAQMEIEY